MPQIFAQGHAGQAHVSFWTADEESEGRHAMQTKPLRWKQAGHGAASIDLQGRPRQWLDQADGDHDGVRWEKVLTLKAAIACGRYNISSEALAERLMVHLFPGPSTIQRSFDGTKDRA